MVIDENQNLNEQEKSLSETEDLKLKCEEYLNGWKRAKADFINYQKDEARRAALFLQFSNEAIIRDLIIVLDSFTLAAEALAKEALTAEEKSLLLIQSQLEDLLKKYGLEKLEVAVGQPFDPNFHEAIAEVESIPLASSGQVAEILENGYTLHGKLLRAVKVKVVK